jgi:hemerythrin-like domain-containing protein
MHALDSFRRDHRQMRLLDDALALYAAGLLAGRSVQAGDLGHLAGALRIVADYRHFEKHEQVLQPLLVRNGISWNLHALRSVRERHSPLRALIGKLERAATRDPGWTRHEQLRVAATALDLASCQDRLMEIQEMELFPEIIARLDAKTLAALTGWLARFDELTEHRLPGVDVPGLCRALASRC